MIRVRVVSLEARIRTGPNTVAPGVGTYYLGSIFLGTQIIDDTYFPGNPDFQWLDLGNGTFVAMIYKGKRQLTIQEENPVEDLFGIVRDDFDIYGKSRPTYNLGRTTRGYGSNNFVRGLPMVRPYNGVEPSLLDNTMLDFILQYQPSMSLANKLSNLIGLFDPDRAFNNFQGIGFAIEDGRIVNRVTTKYYNVLTGRTKIKILSPTPVMYKGTKSYAMEVINTLQDYSHYNPVDHWWLFFHPKNSVREPLFNARGRWTGYYKEDIVEDFHWFESKTVLPLHGRGSSVAYIPAAWVTILSS